MQDEVPHRGDSSMIMQDEVQQSEVTVWTGCRGIGRMKSHIRG